MDSYSVTRSWNEPDYFDNHENPNFYSPYYGYSEIRLSIFFITAVCVGLPCLVWAFYSVHRLRKAKGGISAFIVLLLVSDLLQLLLYPYIVTKLITRYSPHEEIYIIVPPGFLKICSLHLHQLVALEGVLTLKYPTISAHLFSSPCYIIISIIILLVPIITVVALVFAGGFSVLFAFGSIVAPVCLLVVTGIIIYKAPPTAASTPVNHRPGAKVFTVSLVTFLVLYLPCVIHIRIIHKMYDVLSRDVLSSWIGMTFCLISLTVISEPLLCVLVCRENLSTQTKPTQIEVNAEETSV